MNWWNLIFFIAFILGTAWIGVTAGRRDTRTREDFLVGNRQVGTTFLAAILIATWASSYTILASAEVGYLYGVSGALWYAVGVAVPILFFLFPVNLVRRIRAAAPRAYTVVEYIGSRFDRKTHLLALVIMFTGTILEVVAQTYGLSMTLLSFAGLSPKIGVWLVGSAFVVAVSSGGEWSLAAINYMLLIVMGIAFPTVIAVGLLVIGGPDAVVQLPANHRDLLAWGPANMLNFFLLLTALTLTEPVIWQQIFAGRSDRGVAKAVGAMSLGWIPLALAGGLFGLMGAHYFGVGMLRDPSSVAPNFVQSALPQWVGITFLIGLTAVHVSTAAGYLLSAVAITEVDVLQRYVPHSDRFSRSLGNTRLVAVSIGLVAIILSQFAGSQFRLLLLQSSFKVPILFPLIAGLFLPPRWLSGDGAFYGTLVGLVAGVSIYSFRWSVGGLPSDLAGTLAALLLYIVFSLSISRLGARGAVKRES